MSGDSGVALKYAPRHPVDDGCTVEPDGPPVPPDLVGGGVSLELDAAGMAALPKPLTIPFASGVDDFAVSTDTDPCLCALEACSSAAFANNVCLDKGDEDLGWLASNCRSQSRATLRWFSSWAGS
jgi:hypothetical protein